MTTINTITTISTTLTITMKLCQYDDNGVDNDDENDNDGNEDDTEDDNDDDNDVNDGNVKKNTYNDCSCCVRAVRLENIELLSSWVVGSLTRENHVAEVGWGVVD